MSGGYSGSYAREGSYGLGIQSGVLFEYKHSIHLIPGRTYVLSAYVKVVSASTLDTGHLAYLNLVLTPVHGHLLNIATGMSSVDTDWSFQTSTFVVPMVDEGHVTARLRLLSADRLRNDGLTSATIRIDHVSLQLLDGHAGATRRRCNHNLDLHLM